MSKIKKGNMTTDDKKQIIDRMVIAPIKLGVRNYFLHQFLKDTKNNDPGNQELIDYIIEAQNKLNRGKKTKQGEKNE